MERKVEGTRGVEEMGLVCKNKLKKRKKKELA